MEHEREADTLIGQAPTISQSNTLPISVRLVVAGADLLWKKNTAGWLVAGADSMWEKNTAGWLADKPSEQSGCKFKL